MGSGKNKAFLTILGSIAARFVLDKKPCDKRMLHQRMFAHLFGFAGVLKRTVSATAVAERVSARNLTCRINKAHQAFVNYDRSHLLQPAFQQIQPISDRYSWLHAWLGGAHEESQESVTDR